MLDSVLLGPEGEKWKKNMGKLDHPREYEDWLDAQAIPSHMKLYVSNWKDVIYPLKKTRSRPILDEMWFYINIVGTNHPTHIHLLMLKQHHTIELPGIYRQGYQYTMESWRNS